MLFLTCRYAKATLPPHEVGPVLAIWADHLWLAGGASKVCFSLPVGHTDDQEDAVLVLLSCGHIRKAVELLLQLDRPSTAAQLTNACLVSGAVTVAKGDGVSTQRVFSGAFVTKVFTAYARYLQGLGLDLPSSRLVVSPSPLPLTLP
jgi:hypothetical protein